MLISNLLDSTFYVFSFSEPGESDRALWERPLPARRSTAVYGGWADARQHQGTEVKDESIDYVDVRQHEPHFVSLVINVINSLKTLLISLFFLRLFLRASTNTGSSWWASWPTNGWLSCSKGAGLGWQDWPIVHLDWHRSPQTAGAMSLTFILYKNSVFSLFTIKPCMQCNSKKNYHSQWMYLQTRNRLIYFNKTQVLKGACETVIPHSSPVIL